MGMGEPSTRVAAWARLGPPHRDRRPFTRRGPRLRMRGVPPRLRPRGEEQRKPSGGKQYIHWSRRDCGPGSEPQTHLPAGRQGGGGSRTKWRSRTAQGGRLGPARAGPSGCASGPAKSETDSGRAPGRERVGGAAFPEVRRRGGELGRPTPEAPSGASAWSGEAVPAETSVLGAAVGGRRAEEREFGCPAGKSVVP